MNEVVRYAVVIDPLGMANVVSDREPGPGPALCGLTGSWRHGRVWYSFDEAVAHMQTWNQRHKPARPAERAGE